MKAKISSENRRKFINLLSITEKKKRKHFLFNWTDSTIREAGMKSVID